MARTYKLTWQAGSEARPGRWKKKYKSKICYFDGGKGKTDRVAYEMALAEWERKKIQLEADMRRPLQAEYEAAIHEWDLVLTWSRKNQEEEMADLAASKVMLLQQATERTNPPALRKEDLLEGQFNRDVQEPGWEEFFKAIASMTKPDLDFHSRSSSSNKNQEGSEISAAKPESQHKGRTVVVPLQDGFYDFDQYKRKQLIWQDRIAVMTRSLISEENTVAAQIKQFLLTKHDRSVGRQENIRHQMDTFAKWIGGQSQVTDIGSKELQNYHQMLTDKVRSETKFSTTTTAGEYMATVKSFVHWLWITEQIPTQPRVLDGKSSVLEFRKSSSEIIVFTNEEIRLLLSSALDRSRLFILLMLNCGMTQKDIADLKQSEVDWTAGRITRKRSKTSNHQNVPIVSYLLWDDTRVLLEKEQSSSNTELVLLNKNGSPLRHEEQDENGKYKKSDNIRSAYERLRRSLGLTKTLKSLKKTSATLIAGHADYRGLEDLFLGHAPRKMSDRHYAKAPQALLDNAVAWLGEAYQISDILSKKKTAVATAKA